jgi:hypothetical protein
MVFPPEGELAPPADLLAPRTPQAPTVPGTTSAHGGIAPTGYPPASPGPSVPTSPVRGRPNLTVVK